MSSRHKSLRIKKSFDVYTILFGSAGFAVVKKNNKRITPKNVTLILRKRKEKTSL